MSTYNNVTMEITEIVLRPQEKCVTENLFFLILHQKYVMGTKKNCLSETALLSTQNICLD